MATLAPRCTESAHPGKNATVKRIDVALSFAGEQRPYVHEVAQHLIEMGLRVFYDKAEARTLWGEDLGNVSRLVRN